MAFNDFSAESPENFEQKCLCVLVLDVSGSMGGAPIQELNKGLQAFQQDINQDSTAANRLELSIITFNDSVSCLQDPALVDTFTMPMLTASGTTKLVDGVREGIAKVDARKKWYKSTGQPYYRPWVILITDGEPDNGQDVDGLASEIQLGVDGNTFIFYAVGVKGANENTLVNLSHKMPHGMLDGLKFSEFFRWLSASMSTVTSSTDGDKVDLPDPSDWMKGFTI